MKEFFSGMRLYGDDMDEAGVLAWYRDEERAYYELWGQNRDRGFYDYHALNTRHGFRHLPVGSLGRLLSFGGANGEEVRPIAARASSVVLVDPTDYGTRELAGTKVEYRRPNSLGALPADDGEFQALTCFGVLHHIPDVTRVVREFARSLSPGGIALIREPIVSMGDWRRPRRGLTSRERGIPLQLFDEMIRSAGFEVLRRQRCVHPLTPRVARVLGVNAYNSPQLVALDMALCTLPPWRTRYHAFRWWQRLRPAAVAYVLRKH
ncbi:MAG TPA: class I SAM-dependent methyltransferase [Steroidobacteraceae bacterium]|nr:class I SAM-dependent methyltransferase [Steroidobacteraceae bacterium]